MNKLLTIANFWGPVFTVAFTVVYHLAANFFGFTVTYGWLWLALLIGVFIGGTRAGLICGAWVTAYAAVTVTFVDDPTRVIQIGLISIIGAWLVGHLKDREERLEQAMWLTYGNGNIKKMRRALSVTRECILHVADYTPAEMMAQLRQIESDTGNALAVLDGYKMLREEIDTVNSWYSDPANATKVRKLYASKTDSSRSWGQGRGD